ncbi:alanine racemase [Roseateles sp.]|uniref:alanine racemase n=1 Tax=Roseateles sp. TaxID=1971397 RepID=UPI003D0B4898
MDLRTSFLSRIAGQLPDDARDSLPPTYFYDLDIAAENVDRLRAGLPPQIEVAYSLKANCEPDFVAGLMARRTDLVVDVCSLFELELVLELGVAPSNIVFTGPGKTAAELRRAVRAGVTLIVCESIEELRLLDALAAERGQPAQCLLRINPASTAAGLERPFSGVRSHFGIDLDELQVEVGAIRAMGHVRVCGLHFYVGSRNLDAADIARSFHAFREIFQTVNGWFEGALDTLDLGGGFGVPYYDWEAPLDLTLLRAELASLDLSPFRRVLVESGRFIAASSAVYLCRVLYTKQRGGRDIAVLDGGLCSFYLLSDHAAMSQDKPNRNFLMAVLGKSAAPGQDRPWDLYGNAPTGSDVVGRSVPLPALAPGDLLAVFNAGAYGRMTSLSQFLGRGLADAVLLPSAAQAASSERST